MEALRSQSRDEAWASNAPGIEPRLLSAEVKAWASFLGWLEDALHQAELSARDGKTPAVVLHRDGRKYKATPS